MMTRIIIKAENLSLVIKTNIIGIPTSDNTI